jgi:hypothetical protein
LSVARERGTAEPAGNFQIACGSDSHRTSSNASSNPMQQRTNETNSGCGLWRWWAYVAVLVSVGTQVRARTSSQALCSQLARRFFSRWAKPKANQKGLQRMNINQQGLELELDETAGLARTAAESGCPLPSRARALPSSVAHQPSRPVFYFPSNKRCGPTAASLSPSPSRPALLYMQRSVPPACPS